MSRNEWERNGRRFRQQDPEEFEADVSAWRVNSCVACGALVLDADAAQHVAWHASQEKRVTDLQNQFDMTREVNNLWDGS